MPDANRSAVLYRDLGAKPSTIARGSGVYLFDTEGKRYLDGSASAGVVGIGHGRTEIAEALRAAGDSVVFVYGSSGFTHPWQEELARRLVDGGPENMRSVYFVSGGSEANESAIKLARQYHVERGNAQKHKLIARWQGYHGVTLATLSLSGRTSWRQIYSPYMLPVTHITPPYAYRSPYPIIDDDPTIAMAEELERAIQLEGPDTVSAFFAEPVVGTSAAALVPDPAYYRRVREICDRYDVLFVADEVLCGYGRTGKTWAIQHWGVEPDIITAGKMIGSGYTPLGAMIVSEKVEDALRNGTGRFVHGFTYSGMPASCFVGLEVARIMEAEGLFTRGQSMEQRLLDGLRQLQERHEMIGDVRGIGLMAGIEFVADRHTRVPFPREAKVTARIMAGLRRRGVLVGAGVTGVNYGADGDHIQISPPLVINADEIDTIVAALDATLSEDFGSVA